MYLYHRFHVKDDPHDNNQDNDPLYLSTTLSSPRILSFALPSSYGDLINASTSLNAKAYYIASCVQFGILEASLMDIQDLLLKKDTARSSPQIKTLDLHSSHEAMDHTSTSFNAKAYYIASRVQFGILEASLMDIQDLLWKKDTARSSPQITILDLYSSHGAMDHTSTSFNAKAYYIASRVQFGILEASLLDFQDLLLKKDTECSSPRTKLLDLDYAPTSFNAKAYYIASRVQFGILIAMMQTFDRVMMLNVR
jgi:hypothetical protein